MGEPFDQDDLSLPLLSNSHEDIVEREKPENSYKKTVKIVVLVWSLAAVLVLGLLTLENAWDDMLANTRDVFRDVFRDVRNGLQTRLFGDDVVTEVYRDTFRGPPRYRDTFRGPPRYLDFDAIFTWAEPAEDSNESVESNHFNRDISRNQLGPRDEAEDLTAGNFQAWMDQHPIAFVDFSAPQWCVWSQRLMPTWIQFAQEIKRLGLPVGIGKVDCTAEEALCRRQKIMAFPTLRWYEDGQAFLPDYKLDRNVDDLIAFTRQRLNPSFFSEAALSLDEEKPDLAEEIDDAYDGDDDYELPVGDPFVAGPDPVNHDEDDKGELSSDDVPIGTAAFLTSQASQTESLFSDRLRYWESTLEYLRSERRTFSATSPGTREQKVTATEINAEQWEEFRKTFDTVFVNFYAPWAEASQRLGPVWDEVAQVMDDRGRSVAVAKVNCEAEAALCHQENVFAAPTLLWYIGGERPFKYPNDDFSTQALVNFASLRLELMSPLDDTSSDEARDFPIPLEIVDEEERSTNIEKKKAEDDQERKEQEKNGETLYHGSNGDTSLTSAYESIAKDSTVHVLTVENWDKFHQKYKVVVILYSSSRVIGNQGLQTIWEQFSQAVDDRRLPVGIATVDCISEAYLCSKANVIWYPIIRFEIAEGSIEYLGPPTLDALLQYTQLKLREVDMRLDDDDSLVPYAAEEGIRDLDEILVSDEGDYGEAEVVDMLDVDLSLQLRQDVKDMETISFHSIDIATNSWNAILAINPDAFLFFGAPWCSHSIIGQAVWESFAKKVEDMNLRVTVASVDCTIDMDLCEREGIRFYPTMRWYKDGVAATTYECEQDPDCNGHATAQDLLAYTQTMMLNDGELVDGLVRIA